MQKINKNNTFDNLIVSNDNQKTIEMLKGMNTSANLFYIVGDVGVGKTHLIQAVANQSKQKNIIYVTLEQFLAEFTKALRDKEYQQFKEKYLNCDMLIIDDFQYCDNKEATQEELLKIIKLLLDNDKKVILVIN
jgi:chromosomal replication initiator protein